MERRKAGDFSSATDHEGRVLGFHALRHTCGVWIAQAGASPKAIQTITRHSTIELNIGTYRHLMPSEHADTIARLP